ncbi:hypothetical protein EB796_008506 [Bugula neritina]|uniref:Uncharacterized protein n=1 Tax=Bugula neritina TaxID=10212 RepID=A0A7J7K4P9_BUGNE|nr:hypothetical protein EB796_008506 [Bugula neritina]
MKLPVSGYLAGWMFYIADPFDLNRCPSSYARIMSERSPGLYHIAIHNDLSSYYELDTGLRFNFQQFSNGRVRKDDFIALGSSKTPEKLNCTNVVSVSRNADNTYGEAAIKAYISEYLALKSAPTPDYTGDLGEGEIWISLPPKLTSEESVVVAGYRVVCATDTDLLNKVECHDSFIPVDTDRVLLSLPDASIPYYVAVQINDKEVIKQNDILGIAASGEEDCNNLISVSSQNAALKAYISEYIALNSAPTPDYTGDLGEGEIWISLPPKLTSEESVVVAGYRVVCATDTDLLNKVECHDSFIPVDTDRVLLSLPDASVPYYVAVQIVRNFQGEELLEDKYSPSVQLCPGIYKYESVFVTSN